MAELCRRHGISQQTFSRWRQKYGGLDRSDATRLKSLEDENARLKRLVAEQALDLQALRDLLRKNAPRAAGAPWRMKMAAATLSAPAGA
jgi:putative transposase